MSSPEPSKTPRRIIRKSQHPQIVEPGPEASAPPSSGQPSLSVTPTSRPPSILKRPISPEASSAAPEEHTTEGLATRRTASRRRVITRTSRGSVGARAGGPSGESTPAETPRDRVTKVRSLHAPPTASAQTPRAENTDSGNNSQTSSATNRAQLSINAIPTEPVLLALDATVFNTMSFSAPVFVNNIANRILFPVINKFKDEQKKAAQKDNEALSKLRGSDGSSLFGSNWVPAASRLREEADSTEVDYSEIATILAATIDHATQEVTRLLTEEEGNLQAQEVRCKRVEIREKRQLAKVRLGLESTSARLQEYENCVTNAQAATAGIEQHLAQSNTRVQRGKAVSQLLKYFKMFVSLGQGELATVLKNLSKTRAAQRTAVTDRWLSGRVSPFNPRYFTTVVSVNLMTSEAEKRATAALNAADDAAAGNAPLGAEESAMAAAAAAGAQGASTPEAGAAGGPRRKAPNAFKKGARRRRDHNMGEDDAEAAAQQQQQQAHAATFVSPEQELAEAEETSEPDDLDDDDDDEHKLHSLDTVKLVRAETSAVGAGLDRLFAVRYATELQVEWGQKMVLLAKELGDAAESTANIDTYVTWLRQELVSDLFHIISCFDDFYEQHPDTAVHQSYGRALLKTMELISRLYTTLTPLNNDLLLSVFFSRSVNDLAVTLFTEYSPRMLPGQPPLPNPTPILAMDHYNKNTKEELKKSFKFLIDRIERDVIVVETVFGMTSTARQQILSRVTDGVVKPFIMQQIKLAETHRNSMLNAEAQLSPRTKRRCAVRVADAIAYHHTMEVRLFSFYQDYVAALKKLFSEGEVDFLNKFVEVIFPNREAYSTGRAELDLLIRYYALIEERYTRLLHPAPDEVFDLREDHMAKTKEMMGCLMEVTQRVQTYALPKEVGPYLYDTIVCGLKSIGNYLDTELRKSYESVKADKDNWRLKPKTEDMLLRPTKPESQQCGFRMLLFAQSSLMSLSDSIAVICMPLLHSYPRLAKDVDEARNTELDGLDDRAEKLLNMCLQAVIVRSLSILSNYQNRADYLVKETKKKDDVDVIAPPCTRACTLFCYYVTRQLSDVKEFIRLSNGQVPQRQTSSQLATSATLRKAVQRGAGLEEPSADAFSLMTAVTPSDQNPAAAVRARARTMNLQQLLYGDGGPSSFTRTLGVCLYRGIVAHVKTFTANDRGAMVYKQDVTAYKEAMAPLTSTPGLGGAVVEVLFQLLKETSSLLIMPMDHIKEVKESGLLRLMSNEEKMQFLRIRQDVRDALKIIQA